MTSPALFNPFEENDGSADGLSAEASGTQRSVTAIENVDIPDGLLSAGSVVNLETGVNVMLRNSGAVISCEVPLIPGKVTELIGANGSGKTTTQRTLNGVLKRSGAGLGPRDGVDAGSLEWPGVSVRIGKRMTVNGEPGETFVMIDDGEELGQFIDPEIDKPEAADKKRIEALLRLANVAVDDAKFIEFIGQENWKLFTDEVDVAKMGVVDRVSSLKRWIDSKAKSSEVIVSQLDGVLEGLGTLPDIEDSAEDHGVLEQQRMDEAIRLRELEASKRASDEARKSLDSLGETVGNRDDCESLRNGAEQELAQLTAEIDRLTARKITAAEVKKSMDVQIDQIDRFQRKREELENTASGTVTDQDIESCRLREQDLKDRSKRALIAAQRRSERAEKAAAIEKTLTRRQAAEQRAALLRKKAKLTATILSDAVNGLAGWSIDASSGGVRLMCEHQRGLICFDQLSPGEKAVRGLEVVCRKAGDVRGRIPYASIVQSIWESLDSENQEHVLRFAADNGVAILTCRASRKGEDRSLQSHVLGVIASEISSVAAEKAEPD